MPMRRIGAAIGVVALLFALSSLGGLMVDWAWFASIGYARVFWTALLAKATVFGDPPGSQLRPRRRCPGRRRSAQPGRRLCIRHTDTDEIAGLRFATHQHPNSGCRAERALSALPVLGERRMIGNSSVQPPTSRTSDRPD